MLLREISIRCVRLYWERKSTTRKYDR